MDKFKDNLTKRIFDGEIVKGFPIELLRRTIIKITMIEAATDIHELATPPSNRLEKLKGDRAGHWSIRVSDKYRICFNWNVNRAYNIEFTDYH